VELSLDCDGVWLLGVFWVLVGVCCFVLLLSFISFCKLGLFTHFHCRDSVGSVWFVVVPGSFFLFWLGSGLSGCFSVSLFR